MKALVFSDLHTSYKALANVASLLEKDKSLKLIIFAGDVVNMGEPVGYMLKFIDMIQQSGRPLLWVPGNNDFGRAYHKLNAVIPSLEGRVVQLSSLIPNTDPVIRFTGVGGSPESWSGQYAGESMIDRKAIANSIFVSHVPPPGILTLQHNDIPPPKVGGVGGGMKTTGRRFADAPLVHICGHVHHQWGCAYLGQTKVIKLASSETGHYGILDLKTLAVEFKRFS